MSKYVIEDTTLTNIGAAIREKTSTSSLLMPENMPDAIRSIEGGGAVESPWQHFILPNIKTPNTLGTYEFLTDNTAPTVTMMDMGLSTSEIYGGENSQGTLLLAYKIRSTAPNESGAYVTELNGWNYIGSSWVTFTNYATNPDLTQEIMFFTRQWRNSDLSDTTLSLTLPKLMYSSYYVANNACYWWIAAARFSSGIRWFRQVNQQSWTTMEHPSTGATTYALPSMMSTSTAYDQITRRLANRPLIVVNQGFGTARSSTAHWINIPATNYYTPMEITDTTTTNKDQKNLVPAIVTDLNRTATREHYFQMACLWDMSGQTANVSSTIWRIGFSTNPTMANNMASLSWFYFIPAQVTGVNDPADLSVGNSTQSTSSVRKARKKAAEIEEEPGWVLPEYLPEHIPTEEEMLP